MNIQMTLYCHYRSDRCKHCFGTVMHTTLIVRFASSFASALHTFCKTIALMKSNQFNESYQSLRLQLQVCQLNGTYKKNKQKKNYENSVCLLKIMNFVLVNTRPITSSCLWKSLKARVIINHFHYFYSIFFSGQLIWISDASMQYVQTWCCEYPEVCMNMFKQQRPEITFI